MSPKGRGRHAARSVIVVAGLLAIWSCSGSEPIDHGETSFADLDAYFASDEWKNSDRDRVIFIGIDGAGWPFIDALIERGELPNFARLKEHGAHGVLRSVPCYFSPPAWTTLMSGYLPEKSGIHTFGKFRRDTHEFVNVNSQDKAIPSVWDVATYAAKRSAIVNVPVTFPVHPVNGVAVSGLMTPIEVAGLGTLHNTTRENLRAVPVDPDIKSYSRIFRAALDDPLNSFRWSLYDVVDDGERNYQKALISATPKYPGSQRTAQSSGPHLIDVGEYSPWVKVRAVRRGAPEDAWCKLQALESDRGHELVNSPVFFPITAPYCYPDSFEEHLRDTFGFYLPTKFVPGVFVPESAMESVRYAKHILELEDWDLFAYVFTQTDNIHHLRGFTAFVGKVYEIFDAFLGHIMDRIDDDTTLLIASDHGFGQFKTGVDLNQYLETSGLLRRHDDGTIDHDNTLVFHNLWHLYFNHALVTKETLNARGIEVPAGVDAVTALQDHLRDLGREIKARSGEPLPLDFVALPRGAGPDMRVDGVNGDHAVEFWNLREPQPTPFFEFEGGGRFQHVREGVFAAWGNGVEKGADLGVLDIQDVAPTILYLLDLPIAADMDGTVIDVAFTPGYRARNVARSVPDYAPIQTEELDGVDRESLEEKLRSLGYIR